MAPSLGSGLKVKVPPVVPVMVAVAPVQSAVMVNDGSPLESIVTSTVLIAGQASSPTVY